MKNLLFKEFRLAIHPMVWVFSLFGAMIFIPNYPNTIFAIYVMMAFLFLFQGGKENNDLFYSELLPIKKRDIIKARFLSILSFEMLSVIVCAIVSAITYSMNYGLYGKQISSLTTDSFIGIPPDPAYFGIVLFSFGVFNSIFLHLHYKNGFKMLVPMIVATVAAVIPLIAAEVLSSMSGTPLESVSIQLIAVNSSTALCQSLILIIGVLFYVFSLLFTFKREAVVFEKTDI